MRESAQRITFDQWDRRYESLKAEGLCEPAYGGPLRRHLDRGDRRLAKLRMDNSPAALRLWNFLCSEEDRLRQARAEGKHLVGAMKDLGTIPVMAYSLDDTVAFYADGAWWLPCLMEQRRIRCQPGQQQLGRYCASVGDRGRGSHLSQLYSHRFLGQHRSDRGINRQRQQRGRDVFAAADCWDIDTEREPVEPIVWQRECKHSHDTDFDVVFDRDCRGHH